MVLNDYSGLSEGSPVTRSSFLFRVVLALLSLFGLFGWSYLVLLLLAYGGRRIFVSPAAVAICFGYAYLLLSLYASLKKPSLKRLLIVGVLLNSPLIALFIYAVATTERPLRLGAFIPVAFVLAWTALSVARWLDEHQISAGLRFATIIVSGAGLVSGAILVWPLTIDHESESRRFLMAAFYDSPLKARSNFAEAVQHASQIREPYQRTALLQQIAVGQSRQRLYDESDRTIETYLNELDQSEKRELLTSILRAEIENKDYQKALATGRKLNSSGPFTVQPLTLEAISKAKAGQTEEARQILDVATTLTNEQHVGTTQTHSFIHLAEACSKVGFHDEGLTWALKVGPQKFAALGSTGVNEAEAGYKESASHTMQVIEESVNTSARECLSHPTVQKKDSCLGELVDKLGDARFFRLARATAGKIVAIPSKDRAFRRILAFEAKFRGEDLESRILQR